MRFLFPRALRGLCSAPSPTRCGAGSSSLALSSTSENWPLQPAVTCGHATAPSTGFLSSSRRQLKESTDSALPTMRLLFRPQRFSRSRRFSPLPALWACFIPLPRAGFAFQGFSPPLSRCDSSPHLFSPRVVETASPAIQRAAWRQIRGPRLQGLVPRDDP
jgi:hypothetical protein